MTSTPMSLARLSFAGTVALGVGFTLVPLEAQAVTVWNWTIAGVGVSGAGTFETADVVPTPATTYEILAIAGTVTRLGVVTTIAGLNSNFTSFFQWDGAAQSPILASPSGSGIFWFSSDPELSFLELYSSGPSGYAPASLLFFTSDSTSDLTFSISQSTLAPQQDPAGVPAPLPLAGAAVALRFSRIARRHIRRVRL